MESKFKFMKVRGQLSIGNKYGAKGWEYALDYTPGAGDRILLTVPQSGTYLARYIILCILSKGQIIYQGPKTYNAYFLEVYGERVLEGKGLQWEPEGDSTGRFIETHMKSLLVKYSPKARYLIVIRNPKDVVVSFYHYLTRKLGVEMEFQEFFSLWISGDGIPYGDYFENVRQYWQHRDVPNCTLLIYERMLENPRETVETIGKFLGPKYVERLSERYVGDPTVESTGSQGTPILFEAILKASTFKAMRDAFGEEDLHFRKGIIGDWKSIMTRDQSDLIDQRVREVWAGMELETLWEREMKW